MKPTRPEIDPSTVAACKGCEGVDSARLAPCSSCGRHVFVDSARCPFCGTVREPALASAPSRPSTWAPRVAAIVAMTALASCDRPSAPSTGAAPQGTPIPDRDRTPRDAGTDAGAQRAPTQEHVPMTAVPPYGVAPPPPPPPDDAGPDAIDAPSLPTSVPREGKKRP